MMKRPCYSIVGTLLYFKSMGYVVNWIHLPFDRHIPFHPRMKLLKYSIEKTKTFDPLSN